MLLLSCLHFVKRGSAREQVVDAHAPQGHQLLFLFLFTIRDPLFVIRDLVILEKPKDTTVTS